MAFDAKKYTKNPFLKGEDLEEGERIVVTIKSAQEVTFPSGDTVPVLEFFEIEQKLTLNKTRIRKLIELLGEDTDEWVMQRISLYPVDVTFQGKTVSSVGVGKAPAKAKRAVVEDEEPVERPKRREPVPEVEFEQAAKKRSQGAPAVAEEEEPF